jgi:hypothetical protein
MSARVRWDPLGVHWRVSTPAQAQPQPAAGQECETGEQGGASGQNASTGTVCLRRATTDTGQRSNRPAAGSGSCRRRTCGGGAVLLLSVSLTRMCGE